LRRGFPRDLLTQQLGFLVDVTRAKRRILVGWRPLDVAVDADRAAVNDPPHAAALRRLKQSAHRVRIDGAVLLRAKSRLTVERGDVVDDIDAIAGAVQGFGIAKITLDQLDARRAQSPPRLRIRGAARQGAGAIPPRREIRCQRRAGESGRAGDQCPATVIRDIIRGRRIPAGGVARRSDIPNIFAPHAYPSGRGAPQLMPRIAVPGH